MVLGVGAARGVKIANTGIIRLARIIHTFFFRKCFIKFILLVVAVNTNLFLFEIFIEIYSGRIHLRILVDDRN